MKGPVAMVREERVRVLDVKCVVIGVCNETSKVSSFSKQRTVPAGKGGVDTYTLSAGPNSGLYSSRVLARNGP